MTDIIDSVKKRLADCVYDAIGGYVSTNWNISVVKSSELPVSTIKFEPITLVDETYCGSQSKSTWMYVDFSIVVFSEVDRTGDPSVPINYTGMDYVDSVVDKLLEISDSNTEQDSYRIADIFDIQVTERSFNRRNRNRGVYGFTISGRMRVEWN